MSWVAAIDVGSNAIRLAAMHVSEGGVVRRTISRRFFLRLGTDVFQKGYIGKEAQARLLSTFDDIQEILTNNNIASVRAVATSAMRDAKNGEDIAERLHRNTGIPLKVISGVAEARLARLALEYAVGTFPKRSLLVDLGGGSLELSSGDVRRGRTLPLGTVRLLEAFPSLSGRVARGGLEAAASEVLMLLQRRCRNPVPKPVGFGTGGNLAALARLLPNGSGLYPSLDMTQLWALALELGSLSRRERAQKYGFRADRAELVVPALIILWALQQVFQVHQLVVPGTGLREALLLEQLTARLAANLKGLRSASLGKHTVRLAIAERLFRALRPVHRLLPPALGSLHWALRLSQHQEGDPPSALTRAEQFRSPRQRRWLRALVALARGDVRSADDVLAGFSGMDKEAATKLAAIVQLAGAVDDQSATHDASSIISLRWMDGPPTLILPTAWQHARVPVQKLAEVFRVGVMFGSSQE